MPIYVYHCDSCQLDIEEFHKMSESLTTCPKCKTNHPVFHKVIQTCSISIDSKAPKTIGELAHKNTEKLVAEGKLDKSHLDYENNIKQRKAKASKRAKLASLNEQQKEKYIFEGKL